MSDPVPVPVPTPAPKLAGCLTAIGPYLLILVISVALWVRMETLIAPNGAQPDRIAVAVAAWRKSESPSYFAVENQVRTAQITTVEGVRPALKLAMTPAAAAIDGALMAALASHADAAGKFSDPNAAADELHKMGVAFGGAK